ncbi:hypothetical protein D6825_01310 [Candidatus Woesearchaeota archaeon]|nr:MAG: hypothetical protein D6825_01310 [Candidatus Woesearchaeota archaeon]
MSGLSPWTWIATGLLVSLTSIAIGDRMILFAWIGLAFLAIGVAKLVFVTITTAQKSPLDIPKEKGTVLCTRCYRQTRADYNFCGICGAQLRKTY